MILDETLEIKISPITISHKGDNVKVDTLELNHPLPSMAKQTYKLRRFFVQMGNESQEILSKMGGDALRELVEEGRKQKEALEAGKEVLALHEEYKEDDPENRDAKLKDIDILVVGYMQMVNTCVDVDFYKMITIFGKLLLDNQLCVLKCGDSSQILTNHIWEQQIEPDDRLKATVRYCCFFGLISNAQS